MREMSVALVWHSTTIETLGSVGHGTPIVAGWFRIMDAGTVKSEAIGVGAAAAAELDEAVWPTPSALNEAFGGGVGLLPFPFSCLLITARCNGSRARDGRGDRRRGGCG
jgi:hypothetical protein